jgi:hypothetical protein
MVTQTQKIQFHSIKCLGTAIKDDGFVIRWPSYSEGAGYEFSSAHNNTVVKDSEAIAAQLLAFYTKSITPQTAVGIRQRLLEIGNKDSAERLGLKAD